jgi:purine-binding chemotaxis protein CheW
MGTAKQELDMRDTQDDLMHQFCDDAQYLTLLLDDQYYGIAINKVMEIKGWTSVTPIPNSPEYIRGVLNLRGAIVPVIDLRLRFNLPEVEYTAFTVIIVVSVNDRLAGIVVDAVSDVISLSEEQHCETPEFEGEISRQFIEGLGQIEDRLLILLNVDKLTSEQELDDAGGEAN